MKPALPDDVVEYRRTPEYDARSIPSGLLKSHYIKAGVWGEIVVVAGSVRYTLEDAPDESFLLLPSAPGAVPPERPHRVELSPDARMFVRFLRAP